MRQSEFTTIELLSDASVRIKDLSITLQAEDWRILNEVVLPELDSTTGRKHSVSEVLFACLTYGLHKAYEDATGEEFVLRMDRKSNEA